MLRTKFFGTTGVILLLSALLLETHFWTGQTRIVMLQTGILAMGLGMFFRLTNEPTRRDPLVFLEDMESAS